MTTQSDINFSIAITGSGGNGVVTMGQLLLNAIAISGHYGLLTRSSGPQIRGGESAVMLRMGSCLVTSQGDSFDLLLALDWMNFSRFAGEIPLTTHSIVLYDPAAGAVPTQVIDSGAELHALSIAALARSVDGARPNMLALGMLAALMAIDKTVVEKALKSALGRKGEEVISASWHSINVGYGAAPVIASMPEMPLVQESGPHWNISGNEAAGLGALRGGVRLVAAYPITPATELLEWMAPQLEKVGGTLVQAEDELASIHMVIGASFGGVPALTATSGPGLSLMVEGLGLAIASETPLVVVDVMRCGPSTGIATKSEQSDLNIALYGMHGDAPHLVLAPTDIADCVFTVEWATRLAERLQAVAIVLSDQAMGQSRCVIDPPARAPVLGNRAKATQGAGAYERYALTADGISAMAIPGTAGCIYTSDGLEHTPAGVPSSAADDHWQQLEKRYRKLDVFDYGEEWAVQEGEGDICLVTWGSSSGVVREAACQLRAEGLRVRTLTIRLLSPLPMHRLRKALAGVRRVAVVEQNHQGQLFHYLHSLNAIPGDARVLARPGPLPIRPCAVVDLVMEWFRHE